MSSKYLASTPLVSPRLWFESSFDQREKALTGIKVNGFTCKQNSTAQDFFFAGLSKPGLTNNTFGSLVTAANVQQIPGLKTVPVNIRWFCIRRFRLAKYIVKAVKKRLRYKNPKVHMPALTLWEQW